VASPERVRLGWPRCLTNDSIRAMKRTVLLIALVLIGCTEGDPENNPVCGIAAMAGAAMVLEQFGVPGKILEEIPEGVEGVVPARVVGWRTARALAGVGPDGAVLGYEGPGFPEIPGFGLVLVEDSLEVFKGVLVFETEAPNGLPRLGTISSTTSTIPLYGLRVTWGAVSSPRCPLFREIDTLETVPEGN
jgi:hypothetical protein